MKAGDIVKTRNLGGYLRFVELIEIESKDITTIFWRVKFLTSNVVSKYPVREEKLYPLTPIDIAELRMSGYGKQI